MHLNEEGNLADWYGSTRIGTVPYIVGACVGF